MMTAYFQKLQQATDSADELLKSFKISKAPVDPEKIAKKFQIKVLRLPFKNLNVSGGLVRKSKSGKPVIFVNKANHLNRQRFTIAHELGHYILHSTANIHLDEKMVFFRDENSSSATNINEIQANQFAAELLMPKTILVEDVKNYLVNGKEINSDIINDLAIKYKVSQQSLLIRLSKILS